MSTTTATPQPASRVASMLCRLGGMRSDLVDDLPGSRSYYINLACAMLGLGLLSTTSFSYALVSTHVVDSGALALVLGIGWATLMVTIERLLIISMKRRKGDGWQNILQATAGLVVRLGVAVVIGGVVSMPLVLKVFEPAVAAQVQADIVQARTEAAQKLDADFADIPEMEGQIAELDQQLASLPFYDPASVNPAYAAAEEARDKAKKACDKANELAAEEAAGQSGTNRVGYGPEWRRLSQVAQDKCDAYATAEADFNRVAEETQTAYADTSSSTRTTAQAERDRLAAQLEQRRAERQAQELVLYGAINASDGLAARMQALWNLHENNRAIYLGHLFLMLALMMVEVMPVFAKFLKTVGPADDYNRIESLREDAVVSDEEIYEKDRAKATAIRSQIQEASATDWFARQLVIENELNAEAAVVAKEIEQERLEIWKGTERARNADEVARARAKLARRGVAGRNHVAAPTPPPQQGLGLPVP